MTEPKQNLCTIAFHCIDYFDCIYRSGDDETTCKYKSDTYRCNSAVARVNALTIELKELTEQEDANE